MRDVTRYAGTSGASAAVAVGRGMFVVASDDDDVLRTYAFGKERPLLEYDLTKFLGRNPTGKSDIEAAALVGDLAYWLASHKPRPEGEWRQGASRFFATALARAEAVPGLQPVGGRASTCWSTSPRPKRCAALTLPRRRPRRPPRAKV